ncbi:hypothetical protein V4U86_02735 [Mycobacterium sp. AMU20-3851]|uniref:hypothetical protein n=1 Tax=Mycobacterium sp. AMU20-3851 TaxID=3122055 RepID=UPI0037546885
MTKVRPFGYGAAAVAISAGLVFAPVHGAAWADTGETDSAASESASPAPGSAAAGTDAQDGGADAGPKLTKPPRTAPKKAGTRGSGRDRAVEIVSGEPELEAPNSAEPQADSGSAGGAGAEQVSETVTDVAAPESPVAETRPLDRPLLRSVRAHRTGISSARLPAPAGAVLTLEVPSLAVATAPAPALPTAAAAVVSTAIDPTLPTPTLPTPTAPTPPKPLSPIAKVLQLPGRLVNAVLQVFSLTTSANSHGLPNGLNVVNDLIFGVFREIEKLIGLHRTPAVQPVVPTMTYTGPTTRPTPTVEQFLNASTAAYGLGTTPGGLVPFTVNGFQLSASRFFSGMVANTWVTPAGQLIIAYQGTTGGTNLLFNPLITIAQIVADVQVILTRTTPPAFYDALEFAERVRAEAALQGYTDDDIFVTGHSLGGWEAQFVAQRIGLAGIGFEAPGMNSRVPGNGADSMFVTIGTYGSSATAMATDLPYLQPFMPPYVPGGGSKPHYGPIVLIGDPAAAIPLYNASKLWGRTLIGNLIFLLDFLGNFFQYHLPGVQAYQLDVKSDPGVVPFLGSRRGPVHTGYGELTIPQLMKAASDDGILFRP